MILSTVAVLMLVLSVILLTLNVTITHREYREIDRFLDMIIENDGHLPGSMRQPQRKTHGSDASTGATTNILHSLPLDDYEEQREPMRTFFRSSRLPMQKDSFDFHNFFSFIVDDEENLEEISYQFPIFHSQDELCRVIRHILQNKKLRGVYDSFFYKISLLENGKRLLVILNCQSELSTFHHLYYYSLLVWLLALLVSLLFSFVLSGVIIKPVSDALERQKNFISDAGHELKTPIAVIAANVDVLMPDMPDNRWLQYIKAETERMNRLVKDLLFLARDDAGRRVMHITPFDLSNAIENAVLPFESIIFEQGKQLECTVQKGLEYVGDEQQIKQVVIILLDNAIKNSEAGAFIRVHAYQESFKIVIKVYNTGHGIKEEDLQKIFLRFYRADSSRARMTGGYGLGLAIAKAISDAHNGALSVASKYGEWAEFTFTLPLASHS